MNTDDHRCLFELAPGIETLGHLALESPSLAEFQHTMRDWTLMELLKADGLITLGAIGCLTRAELCGLPSIGVQSADDVIDLLIRIGSAVRSDESAEPATSPLGASAPVLDAVADGWDDWDAFAYLGQKSTHAAPVVPGVENVDDQSRSGYGTVADLFPSLRAVQDLPLKDLLFHRGWANPGDDLAHGWIGRTGADTVKDLLGLTRQDFLDARGLGPTKVSHIYEYLTRLADVAHALSSPDVGDGAALPDGFPKEVGGGSIGSARDERRDIVAAWASYVAGAKTWGDVLTATGTAMPDDVASAWQELLAEPVTVTSPGSPLGEFLASDPRRGRVLLARVASSKPVTLQELASEFGVSRERVRQIESKALATMREAFKSSDEWRTVRWAVQRVCQRAGAYAPAMELANALPTWEAKERHLVARLAGYGPVESVLMREGLSLPTASDLPLLADTNLVIDEYAVVEQLESLDVQPHFVDFAVSSIAGIGRVDGQLVRWGGSVVDKAVAVLEVRDEPQDLEQLVVAVYGDSSRSTRNRILEDPRMMRVTKNKIGLRRWGGSRYTGVAELMLDRLASGPMELDELAEELANQYEVSASSVRMYSAAPVFKVSGDVVALRSRRDPFVARNAPRKVRGLYRDHPSGMTAWCVAVDADMLRGSGRSVPQELASDLGVAPGERVDLRTSAGEIPLSWSEHTHSGPQIGSIRELLDLADVTVGDQVVLRFSWAEHVLEIVVVDRVPSCSDVTEEIARRTGLPAAFASSPARIAGALGVQVGEVVSALQARGDSDISQLVGRLASGVGEVAGSTEGRASSGVDALAGGDPEAPISSPSPDRASSSTSGVVSRALDVSGEARGGPLDDPAIGDRQVLEIEYAEAVAHALIQMRDAGYEPAALRKLVATVGSLRASEMLAELSEPTEAFVALYRLGRLDVSIESQMASKRFRGLFSERIVHRAVERLAQHGYARSD